MLKICDWAWLAVFGRHVPCWERHFCISNRFFFQSTGGNEGIHAAQHLPAPLFLSLGLSLSLRTHFNFRRELISAAFHIYMLISHLCPVAAWLCVCQDAVWADKELRHLQAPFISLQQRSVYLSLLLLLISVDCTLPPFFFTSSWRHQMETMVFNCIPSTRHF